MVKYSTSARQEMLARKQFFQHDILWSILYILDIFKILISFKLIAVDAFEYCIFSWKIQKKLKFFQIAKFSEKIEFSKKIQTSNCSKKFAFWVMTKQKNFGARALPRAARAESHIAVKTQKSCFFGIGGRIFWARARQKCF